MGDCWGRLALGRSRGRLELKAAQEEKSGASVGTVMRTKYWKEDSTRRVEAGGREEKRREEKRRGPILVFPFLASSATVLHTDTEQLAIDNRWPLLYVLYRTVCSREYSRMGEGEKVHGLSPIPAPGQGGRLEVRGPCRWSSGKERSARMGIGRVGTGRGRALYPVVFKRKNVRDKNGTEGGRGGARTKEDEGRALLPYITLFLSSEQRGRATGEH